MFSRLGSGPKQHEKNNRFFKQMLSWVDGLIPVDSLDSLESQNLLRKGRLILIISIIAAALCFITPLIMFVIWGHLEIEDFGNYVFGSLFLGNIYLLRKTKSIRITGIVFFIECALIVIGYSFFLGGIHPSAIIFLLFWPFANLFFLSRKVWNWMIGSLILISILLYTFSDFVQSIEILGGELNRPIVFISVLAAFLFNILIGWAYEDHQRKSIRQITELLADLNEAKQKAESANHAKSVFLATMSHELRTPLTAILGYTELMEEEITESGASEQLLEDVGRIQYSSKNLLSQINSILDLSRVESGEEDIFLEPIFVNEVILEATKQSRLQTEKSNNKLELQFDLNCDLSVVADRSRLIQVLLNLISNANKFTDDGVISISVDQTVDPIAPKVIISIRDTGIGLPESNLNRLFEPFVQREDEFNRAYEGSGLGLAICKKFCQLMGSHISAANHPAGGAIFRVELPKAQDDFDTLQEHQLMGKVSTF